MILESIILMLKITLLIISRLTILSIPRHISKVHLVIDIIRPSGKPKSISFIFQKMHDDR